MRKNSNLHKLAYALEKRADFLDDAREWIYDNPELAAGLLGGTLGAGGGALVPTEDGAGGRVRNALIGALLGGGVGAGAGYLGKDAIKSLVFGYDKKTRQFDKDLQALLGKKFSGGKEVVDNPTKLNVNDPDERSEFINDKGEVDLWERPRRAQEKAFQESANKLFDINPNNLSVSANLGKLPPEILSTLPTDADEVTALLNKAVGAEKNPQGALNLLTGQYKFGENLSF